MKNLILTIILISSWFEITFAFEGRTVKVDPSSIVVCTPKESVPLSKCTGGGGFSFLQIEGDVAATLKAFRSNFNFEKSSKYYVFRYSVSKENVACTEGKTCTCGVGIFVIIRITRCKSKIDFNGIYDVSAAAQLRLAEITLDFASYGLPPATQGFFLPPSLSGLDIKSMVYFDGLLDAVKKLNDTNSNPEPIPSFTIKK
jgi:hypothetical protein